MKHNPMVLLSNSTEAFQKHLHTIGIRPSRGTGEAEPLLLQVEGISAPLLYGLQRAVLSNGGQLYVNERALAVTKDNVRAVIAGNRVQVVRSIEEMKREAELQSLAVELEEVLTDYLASKQPKMMNVKDRVWEFGKRTLVMGILNVTPDSFSDGGRYNNVEAAVKHAREMEAAGADIIDIGGESTRPGATPVPLEEELERVIPVVEAVSQAVRVPLSIDTYKAETAERAVRAGAHVINDVWGLKADTRMAEVAAELDVPVVIMHNREKAEYEDFMGEVIRDLRESLALAEKAGIRKERIILDPGIGFGKTYRHNLLMMRSLKEVKALGYPLLLGTSRKSVIAKTLNLPVDERMEGTAATVTLGIANGADIVRVHDVKEMARVVRMTDAMVRDTDAQPGGEENGQNIVS